MLCSTSGHPGAGLAVMPIRAWCICIKNTPAKKFRNAKNGFRVISYSLDMNKDAWVNAIAHDGLVWPYQMADLPTSQWGSKVTGTYGIQYIPQAFLIGPDGKIIGKYNTAEEGENDLKKYLAQ